VLFYNFIKKKGMKNKKLKLTNTSFIPDEIWGIIIQYVDMETLYILFTNFKFIWKIIFENEYHINELKKNFNPHPYPEKLNNVTGLELKKIYKEFLKCVNSGTLNGYTLYGKLRRLTRETKKWKELQVKEQEKYSKKAMYFNFMKPKHSLCVTNESNKWCNIL